MSDVDPIEVPEEPTQVIPDPADSANTENPGPVLDPADNPLPSDTPATENPPVDAPPPPAPPVFLPADPAPAPAPTSDPAPAPQPDPTPVDPSAPVDPNAPEAPPVVGVPDPPADPNEPPDQADVVYNVVVVVPSFGDHPDDDIFNPDYYGNFPTDDEGGLGCHAVVHRRSDGQVNRYRRRDDKPLSYGDNGDELAIMVLGQFDPRGGSYRALNEGEIEAIEDLVAELKREGVLAWDAEVTSDRLDYPGWQSGRRGQDRDWD